MNNNQKKSASISEEGNRVVPEQMVFAVDITSFGFKNGSAPPANILLDVRFLKNPYWVEELRPLTGLDEPVRKYVLDQEMAQEVLSTLVVMVGRIAPPMLETKIDRFIIALGCTGGQHRSPAMVEALADRLQESYPNFTITRNHRELERHMQSSDDAGEDGQPVSTSKSSLIGNC